jgi:NodT family efflux transporter outer membrane factor (OMF) lipoprotein
VQEFVHNGFKVGPNYQRPPAPLANAWIDSGSPRVKSAPADYSAWWAAFNDPFLNDLIQTAYEQNVSLRIAGTRVLEARAQRAIAIGSLFPQDQTASGSYNHVGTSKNIANPLPVRFFDNWAAGVGASWELDFWGRFRRTIESTDDFVDASIDDYDNVMVTLIGDLAAAYVQYRVFQQQLAYTRENVQLQKISVKLAQARWKGGETSELPYVQAKSLLEQTESIIPALEIGLRQTGNLICVLLGIPPTDLSAKLGEAAIPDSPPAVLVGIPADLIRRRPDIRSAERLVAAQNAQIGVAEADFYPAFFINGNVGLEAKDLGRLFAGKSLTGQIGPSFQWNVLNYGRILNNVRFQDFKTQEFAAIYQQKVLTAAQEVENGIVAFLDSREQAEKLAASVKDGQRSVKLAYADFEAGGVDFNAVFIMEQFLVQRQNEYAVAVGNVALGLIAVYRALGGGWEVRLHFESERAAGHLTTACPNAKVLLGPP